MMEFILSHVEKGVMTLTLNRPERLNSFNDEMHAQLAESLKQAERETLSVACYLQVPGADFVLVRILTIVMLIPQAPHRI